MPSISTTSHIINCVISWYMVASYCYLTRYQLSFRKQNKKHYCIEWWQHFISCRHLYLQKESYGANSELQKPILKFKFTSVYNYEMIAQYWELRMRLLCTLQSRCGDCNTHKAKVSYFLRKHLITSQRMDGDLSCTGVVLTPASRAPIRSTANTLPKWNRC